MSAVYFLKLHIKTMMQQPELKDQPGRDPRTWPVVHQLQTVPCSMSRMASMDPFQGHVVKNLFVKDKKAKQLWLITVRHDLEFKLTSLGNVSFMFP